MKRSKGEKRLDRKFAKIETWEDFLEVWDEVDTEEEAGGLLYAGTKVPYQNRYGSVAEIRERVEFYLLWAGHEDDTVSAIAQQLLIKHWLREARMEEEFWEVHRCLLGFLVQTAGMVSSALEKYFFTASSHSDKRFELFGPPYPRFVTKYLAEVYDVWHHAHEHEQAHAAFQVLTEDLVNAACWWGVSYMFAVDGDGKSTIPIIEQFLEKRGYDPRDVLLTLSGHGEPLPDLAFPGAQDQVKERAALAFLKMKYWFGGGFSAEFRK